MQSLGRRCLQYVIAPIPVNDWNHLLTPEVDPGYGAVPAIACASLHDGGVCRKLRDLPSSTRHVRMPLWDAPVSIPMRLWRTSGCVVML